MEPTPIDVSKFQVAPNLIGDDPEDTRQLIMMADRAANYVRSHSWAPPIQRLLLAYGIGGVLALFLVEFELPIDGTDDQLWAVAGDLPSAYFVIDQARTPADAIEVYCELMEDWANKVLSGGDLSDEYPVEAEPTIEHAEMLLSRVDFIRQKLIPSVHA